VTQDIDLGGLSLEELGLDIQVQEFLLAQAAASQPPPPPPPPPPPVPSARAAEPEIDLEEGGGAAAAARYARGTAVAGDEREEGADEEEVDRLQRSPRP
jgi:hypothetical protein